jgi:alkyldihydroxyacetonephosphate synthase
VRALSQSGLHPSNCRLLDAGEAGLTMAGDGEHAVLVLGFESGDHDVQPAMDRALELCAEHGGVTGEREAGGQRDAVGSWREAFLGAPYLRVRWLYHGHPQRDVRDRDHWGRFRHFTLT